MAWEGTPEAERKKDTLMNRIIYQVKRQCDVEDKLSSLALQVQALQTKSRRKDTQSGRAPKPNNKKRMEN